MNILCFLAVVFLAGCIEGQDAACSFLFPSTNGRSCKVRLSDDQLCQSNPCPSDEYCKVVRGRTSCCTQEFRRLATAFGSDQTFCRERCLAPPRNRQFPPLPVCPCPTVFRCCPGNPPPPSLQPTPELQVPPKTPEPQTPPAPQAPPKTPTPQPQSFRILPNGVCCIMFMVKFLNIKVVFKVKLVLAERCMFSPCLKGGYCRMRNGSALCCKQFHLQDNYKEICLAPPQQIPSNLSDICIKGPEPKPQPPGRPQDGDCCFLFKSGNQDCKVRLLPQERCMFSPCSKGQYCKMRRGRDLCCTQEFRSLSTAFGQNSVFCRESCLIPPRRRPSSTSNVCVKGTLLPQTSKPDPIIFPCPTKSTEAPTPDCPNPSDPANGAVTVNNGKATYSCDYGYTLRPNKVRVCRNGAFKGKTPKCAPLRECTEEGKCRLCLKGAQLCDKSGCDSSQYCRVKKGKKHCCRYQERKRDGKCKQRCNLLR